MMNRLPKFYTSRLLMVLFLVGCSNPDQEADKMQHPHAIEQKNTPTALLSITGCKATVVAAHKSRCLYMKGKRLGIWVPTTVEKSIQILLNQTPVPLSFEQSNDGVLVFFQPESGTLKLTAFLDQPISFSIALKPSSEIDQWEEKLTMLDSLAPLQAIEEIEKELTSQPKLQQAFSNQYLSKIHLRQGQTQQAIDATTLAADQFKSLSIVDQYLDNIFRLIYIHTYLRNDLAKAKQLLSESIDYVISLRKPTATSLATIKSLRQFGVLDVNSQYLYAYYQGVIERLAGKHLRARTYLTQALTIAKNYNERQYISDAQFLLSSIEMSSGNFDKAIQTRQAIIQSMEQNIHPCHLSTYFDGLGYANFLKQENEGISNIDKALKPLKTAEKLVREHCPQWQVGLANVLLNQGLVYNLNHQHSNTATLVEEVSQLDQPLQYEQQLTLEYLKAHILKSEQNFAQALTQFQKLKTHAGSVKHLDFQIKTNNAIAEIYQLIGQKEAAINAYQESQQLLAEQVLILPTYSSSYYMSQMSNFSIPYVNLLIQQGQTQQALQVSQFFRTFWLTRMMLLNQVNLDSATKHQKWLSLLTEVKQLKKQLIDLEQNAWKTAASELGQYKLKQSQVEQQLEGAFQKLVTFMNQEMPIGASPLTPPKSAELFVYFYPSSENTWHVFLQTEHKLIVEQLTTTHQLENDLRQYFESKKPLLDFVKHLKIMPFGPLKRIDFHALKIEGKPLIQMLPVEYGVGLKKLNQEAVAPLEDKTSLIVANSLGDLNASENEALEVESRMHDLKHNVTVLKTRQTHFDKVKQGLTAAKHFHYAGHINQQDAELDYAAIPLTDNTSLNSVDILTMNKVPDMVVLSGCNSAASPQQLPVETLSIAHAFIAAGSKHVIATNKPVKDTEASLIMSEFYTRWTGQQTDFNQAFHQSIQSLASLYPGVEWNSFRLITP